MDSLRIELFKTEELDEINGWLHHRGIGPITLEYLPSLGFMVKFGEKNILCGFLLTTNGPMCFVEGIIANPETSYEDRQDAIKLWCDNAASIAKGMGYKKIMAFPKKERLLEKGVNSGFIYLGSNFHCLTREL